MDIDWTGSPRKTQTPAKRKEHVTSLLKQPHRMLTCYLMELRDGVLESRKQVR